MISLIEFRGIELNSDDEDLRHKIELCFFYKQDIGHKQLWNLSQKSQIKILLAPQVL